MHRYFKQIERQPQELARAHASLLQCAAATRASASPTNPHRLPLQPSFAKLHPEYDGVCMGNRKTCKCGAPFFS